MQKLTPPNARMNVQPATRLLREILETSAEFEKHLGNELTVNLTDLAAMEHLIMSGPLSPTELARRLDVSTAAVTNVIDRLTAVGHVSRVPHATDRRGVVVVPTPASVAKAMGTLMPMILGIDRVLEEFTEDEQETIAEYLQRVLDSYRAHLPEESAGAN